ncbi:MAG: helix-turn-helix transcriptional regulator [Patescibacteria group bacterium]|jgi:ribosome-binding protein aMBF1 (putative translation factor)
MTNEKNEFKQLEEELLKKTAYRKEIEKQDLAFEIAESIIDARIKIGMTQKELAKKMKTKQSGIARLENGRHLSNFKTLEKIAKILGIKMKNPLASELESIPPSFIYPCSWVKAEIRATNSGNSNKTMTDATQSNINNNIQVSINKI